MGRIRKWFHKHDYKYLEGSRLYLKSSKKTFFVVVSMCECGAAVANTSDMSAYLKLEHIYIGRAADAATVQDQLLLKSEN